MEYSKDISTCDAAYVLEPFKKGDKFPAEVIKYATDLTRKISLKTLQYDITKTFADFNSGDFFSKSKKVLSWWHTVENYEINILDIINQIVQLHLLEVVGQQQLLHGLMVNTSGQKIEFTILMVQV